MIETYEQVKVFLAECHIKIEDHPNQKYMAGWPYWRCTTWEEISEAVSHCTIPAILSTHYSGKEGVTSIDIYDEFIWDNEAYRWNDSTIDYPPTETKLHHPVQTRGMNNE